MYSARDISFRFVPSISCYVPARYYCSVNLQSVNIKTELLCDAVCSVVCVRAEVTVMVMVMVVIVVGCV
jgi:hypothetical protein